MKHRKRQALLSLLALAPLLVAAALGAYALRPPSAIHTVRIATGLPGGSFLPVGQVLARTLSERIPGVKFEAIESASGLATVQMLDDRSAEMALLSNHVSGSGRIQMVSVLYEETLQVLVRSSASIHRVSDMVGKRVSLGPEGSGTALAADIILRHFGVAPGQIKGERMGMLAAAEALERGELDAAFMLAGMRTPAVDRLLRSDDITLLSLGDVGKSGSALEGICIDAPFFKVSSIPEGAYGQRPTEAIGTLGVEALLVTRSDLPESLVFDIAHAMYQSKVALAAKSDLLARFSERQSTAAMQFPLHPGAENFFRRNEPSFVKKHADVLSLFVAIVALVASAVSALGAAARQRRRSRIESRYGLAQALAARVRSAVDTDALLSLRSELIDMREQALTGLANEELDASSSFTILQDYLTSQIVEVTSRLERRGALDAPLPRRDVDASGAPPEA